MQRYVAPARRDPGAASTFASPRGRIERFPFCGLDDRGVASSFSPTSRDLLLLKSYATPGSTRTIVSNQVREFNRRTFIMAEKYAFFCSSHTDVDLLALARSMNGQFAGLRTFVSEEIDGGFLRAHETRTVGPEAVK